MYSTINALARGDHAFGKNLPGLAKTDADNTFSKLFGSGLRRTQDGVQDILSRIQSRFPNAKVHEGEVGSGIEESRKAADADKDKTSDRITVSSSLLQNMLGNDSLAAMVEGVVGAFLEGMAGGGAMNAGGSYTQRSVTLTITTVRYAEIHRSRESGEILAASELQTGLQEKITEMLRQIFGIDPEYRSGENEDAPASAEKTPSAPPTNWSARNASSFLWSMELFYSTSMVQGGGDATAAGDFRLSAGYSRFSALAFGQIPSLLSQGANAGGLSGLLDDLLAGLGLSGGVRQTGDGFLLKVTQSRNLIAELMELYGDRIGGKAVAATEETDKGGAVGETAGALSEEMAEAV